MSSQYGDILRAVPKWRQADRKDIQPIKEIGTKCAVLDGGRQVAIAGGQHTNINPNGSFPTQPINHAVL